MSALDQPSDAAVERLQEAHPGANADTGALLRVTGLEGRYVDEYILFRDVRSGRVNAVVVKFRAGLDDAEQRRVLDDAGLARVFSAQEEVAEVEREGLVWRVRRADRQGRLTITVEAPGLIKPGSGTTKGSR